LVLVYLNPGLCREIHMSSHPSIGSPGQNRYNHLFLSELPPFLGSGFNPKFLQTNMLVSPR
jgi:hypothetical protein